MNQQRNAICDGIIITRLWKQIVCGVVTIILLPIFSFFHASEANLNFLSQARKCVIIKNQTQIFLLPKQPSWYLIWNKWSKKKLAYGVITERLYIHSIFLSTEHNHTHVQTKKLINFCPVAPEAAVTRSVIIQDFLN